jgi:hypothetical protein
MATLPDTDPRTLGLTERAALIEENPACGVCPHSLAGHDAISSRFCSATLTGALTRGCVCPSS